MQIKHPLPELSPLLQVGDRVRGEGANARGSVGAIISSTLCDDLFGVTSAVVTGDVRNSLVLSADNERVVGRAYDVDASDSGDGMAPAWKLLGVFKIESPVAIPVTEVAFGDAIVDEPVASLGSRVIRRNGEIHLGRVTAVDLPIHLRLPGSMATRGYVGLIEVTSEPGSAFADDASGGQAVYLENGALLGIIIGGADGRCFVAPLGDLIRHGDFAIADKLAVRRHNERVLGGKTEHSPVNVPPEPIAQRAAEFEAINEFMRVISKVPLFYQSSRRVA